MFGDATKDIIKNIALLIVLGVCIWIGWSDFRLEGVEVTQEEIRESIRYYIRRTIQVAVQYAVPVAILSYFGNKRLRRWSSD